ncbi:MAG: NAD(P)-dependent alcohol dehydrogenase [Woeseiaceae bacterium]
MKLRYKISGGILIVLLIAISALGLVLSHDTACGPLPAVAEGTPAMQAVVHSCYGSPDVLDVAQVARPVPGDGELLVRVRAAAVNPLDWHFLRGSPYVMRPMSGIGAPNSPRLGVDFAGTVEAVGKDVTRFRPGDAVFGSSWGAFAEYVTVGADWAVVPKPDNLSFEQAASVTVAAVTALQALRDKGRLEAGQKVLINGASGGVGTFAVQIAKAMGAEVTGVCSTRNLEMVRSLGADHVIDYTQADYTLGSEHYDLIVDNVGNRSLSANRHVLTPHGILVMVGGQPGNWLGPLTRPLMARLEAPFVSQELVFFIAHETPEDLALLAGLMVSGKVTPVIDRAYPLAETAEAIRYSEQGHARGKIIITMDEGS